MVVNAPKRCRERKKMTKKETKAAVAQVKMKVLAQFVRDMSFENIVAQKGVAEIEIVPELKVAVALDVNKHASENQYELISKYSVSSTNKSNGDVLFLLEMEYGSIFHVEGVPEEQLHPFLLIECPKFVFPFVRRIVSDITRDGGFEGVNLETIDFVAVYREQLALRAAQSTDNKPTI